MAKYFNFNVFVFNLDPTFHVVSVKKMFANGGVMGMDELYSAEVHRQREATAAKEEAAYEQLQAAGMKEFLYIYIYIYIYKG